MLNIKEKSKIMANLLRSGHTMLNLACPVCNNPLFRNKVNEIFCPICNKKVIIEKNDSKSTNNQNVNKDQKINEKEEINNDLNSLKKILKEKINFIKLKLESENQIELIERYVNILNNLIKLLKKLKKVDASAGI